MAGIAARGMLTPEEAMNDPWMRDSNPIMDLLIAYYSQTSPPPPTGKHRPAPKPESQKAPAANSMRKQQGPIQANKPRQSANERDRIMRKIP